MLDDTLEHSCVDCGDECNCDDFPCDGCSLCHEDFNTGRDFGDEDDESEIEWDDEEV